MSIKAINWAFTLPLEMRTKFTLIALCDHADDEGVCWPSRDRVAEKTRQSKSSVSRVMKRLQELGIVAVMERNRPDGSRTSNEIRIDLSLSAEEIGRRAGTSETAEIDGDEPEIDEPEDDGDPLSNLTRGGVRLDRGVVTSEQGACSLVDRANEPSLEPSLKKHSPNPSLGKRGGVGFNADAFKRFLEGCNNWRTMSREKAETAFGFLTPEEQELAALASPLHAAECNKAKRKTLDAHKLIAECFWEKYPDAKPQPAKVEPAKRLINGAELQGLRVASRIGDGRELDSHREIWTLKPEVQHDLAALAPWADVSKTALLTVDLGTEEFAAWRERLRFWLGGRDPTPDRIWLEPYDPLVHDVARIRDPGWRMRRSKEGFYVPKKWPPRRDGTWFDEGNGEAA